MEKIKEEIVNDDGSYKVIYEDDSYIEHDSNGLKKKSFLKGFYQEYYNLKDFNNIKEEYKIEEDENNNIITILRNYNLNCVLTYEGRFKNGKLDGNITHYYFDSGIKRLENKYENGLSSGLQFYYYPSGKLMREVLNENGTWKIIKTYNNDGTLFSIQDKEGFKKF